MMRNRRLARAGRAVVAGLAVLAATSCAGGALTQGSSPAYLAIDSLQAAQGFTPTKFGATLESDVSTKGSVYEDPGQVVIHLNLKDIGLPGNPTTPTSNNEITITRYHVEYTRSDGHNVQGVDVPYAFDGSVTATITGAQSSTFSFILVRAQAKLEAPLAALVGLGGQKLISTIATVTFYGQDQNGNAVSVSGTISVTFADWADPS